MKRILLSILFLGALCPQASNAALFDFSQLKDSLRAVGRYMGVAAAQVAICEGSWQLTKFVNEETENMALVVIPVVLGGAVAVVLGKFRAGARPLSTNALPGDTTNTVVQPNQTNANGSGNVVLTSNSHFWEKAVSDLGVNYFLFKVAHLSEDPSVYALCTAIFAAKALVLHSGR